MLVGPLLVGMAVGMSSGQASLYSKLKGTQVFRATDLERVDVTAAWNADAGERAVAVFFRSFGWPFCQELGIQMRDIKPLLDEAGVKLIAVGIGTPERGQEFCEHIGFPRENLYSDPTSACYTAIGLYKGVGVTFFSPSTPFAILDRLKKDGGKDLFDVLQNWKPWLPPEQDQAFQQGGTFVFAGPQVVFQHYDKSTGDHADLRLVLDSAIPKRV